jgi:hypothetical protein
LVDVRPSKVVVGEQGAWSLEPIVGRTWLGEYTGQRLGPSELDGVSRTYMMEVYNGPHQDSVYIVGDGSKWPHKINHAPHKEANCQFEQNDQRVEVWSQGSIAADTELLADYGFWKSGWVRPIGVTLVLFDRCCLFILGHTHTHARAHTHTTHTHTHTHT